MILVVGELLVDIFPDYKRIGGAPFNFAYHLKNFGLPVRFISRIGEDDLGAEIKSMLDRNGFERDGIQVDPAHPTGRVEVSFDGRGQPRFNIMKDAAFDHIDFAACAPCEEPFSMVYFGTLIQRTPEGCARLKAFLDQLDSGVTCFYDINLRPGLYQPEVIHYSLNRADIVKINEEELEYIRREILQTDGNREDVVFSLMERYNIRLVSLTRGSEGSELFLTGRYHYSISASDVDPIVDTVGAGDGYSAVLALGYIRGWDPQRILSTATMFSASICRIEGAVPSDISFYQHMRDILAGSFNG